MMKAIVFREYGSPDVLELQDIDKPVAEAQQSSIAHRRSGHRAAHFTNRR